MARPEEYPDKPRRVRERKYEHYTASGQRQIRQMDDRDMRAFDKNHRHSDCPWVVTSALVQAAHEERLRTEHPEWSTVQVMRRALIETMKGTPIDTSNFEIIELDEPVEHNQVLEVP